MNIPLLFLYNGINSFYCKLYTIKHNTLYMKSYNGKFIDILINSIILIIIALKL